MNTVKTNVPGLVKDQRSGVVINNNSEQYNSVLAARVKAKEMREIKNNISKLQRTVEEIQEQLRKITSVS